MKRLIFLKLFSFVGATPGLRKNGAHVLLAINRGHSLISELIFTHTVARLNNSISGGNLHCVYITSEKKCKAGAGR